MNKENAKEYLPLVQALAEGKTIQVRITRSPEEWVDERNPSLELDPSYYRIKPSFVLGRKLPGFRELAEGEEWMLKDKWKEGDLLDGERPVMKGENLHKGDCFWNGSDWQFESHGKGSVDGLRYTLVKTTRPLPPLPEPVRMVELAPSDIPPGSFLRRTTWSWSAVQCNNGSEVGAILPFIGSGIVWISMRKLKEEGWEILRPDSTEWMPCQKPEGGKA